MKKLVVMSLGLFYASALNADDWFLYRHAMTESTDGTWDWREGWVYPNTIGFQTTPASMPMSGKAKLEMDRSQQPEQPKKYYKNARPRLSEWMQGQGLVKKRNTL